MTSERRRFWLGEGVEGDELKMKQVWDVAALSDLCNRCNTNWLQVPWHQTQISHQGRAALRIVLFWNNDLNKSFQFCWRDNLLPLVTNFKRCIETLLLLLFLFFVWTYLWQRYEWLAREIWLYNIFFVIFFSLGKWNSQS